jgi:hypothetical protein
MATVADLIEETRRLLFTGQREERNKLTAAINASVTTLTCTYPMSAIQRGAKLSINLEDLYVWDIASQVATVERGQFGSTPASHLINAIINVNPKFSNFEILNAINDEIVSLSSPVNGLYSIATTELTYNAAIFGYNFAAGSVLDILEVRYSVPGTSGEYLLSNDYGLIRNLSDEYAAGSAIYVRDAYPGRTVLVTAKTSFTQLAAAMTTDTSTTGVPTTALDILSLGAAWRLTAPREIKRNFDEVQGDTRRAQEVPPGANLGGSRELQRLRAIRIQEEAARLRQANPLTMPRYPYQASYS